jgi:hypothetical protein
LLSRLFSCSLTGNSYRKWQVKRNAVWRIVRQAMWDSSYSRENLRGPRSVPPELGER